MKKLVILGGSGIGMLAASIACDLGEYEVLGFLNDIEPIGSEIGKFKKYKVIGTSKDVSQFLQRKDVLFFVAYVGMKNEKKVYNKLLSLNIPSNRFATLIHPSAIIPKDFCKIGNGVLIAPLAQLGPDTVVEDNCIMLANSYLAHDSTLKRFAHLAANAVVGANVTVGLACHIGLNATIREKTTIGNFSLVGSGSMVLEDIEEGTIVAGNPSKKLT
ncbi:acetyltransferase [Carboxylicivirga sp. N1Y90]|uniref:acetyltransferase n=1 Tax=Carboxylicivirga fragile TaxID=3417571 RepID=UPI003D343F1D|nr:acetyltransferase [Marinilabiliaceae bacterium N1Y90]